jgi:hypothetical protein
MDEKWEGNTGEDFLFVQRMFLRVIEKEAHKTKGNNPENT